MKRTAILAVVTATTIFAGVYALAASLGGVTSNRLSADNSAVASCDSDGVSASYATGWDATDERYEVTSVTINGVSDTCDGQTLNVSLADSTGTQIGAGSMALPSSAATSFTVNLSTAASAQLTEAVHVLIAS